MTDGNATGATTINRLHQNRVLDVLVINIVLGDCWHSKLAAKCLILVLGYQNLKLLFSAITGQSSFFADFCIVRQQHITKTYYYTVNRIFFYDTHHGINIRNTHLYSLISYSFCRRLFYGIVVGNNGVDTLVPFVQSHRKCACLP